MGEAIGNCLGSWFFFTHSVVIIVNIKKSHQILTCPYVVEDMLYAANLVHINVQLVAEFWIYCKVVVQQVVQYSKSAREQIIKEEEFGYHLTAVVRVGWDCRHRNGVLSVTTSH